MPSAETASRPSRTPSRSSSMRQAAVPPSARTGTSEARRASTAIKGGINPCRRAWTSARLAAISSSEPTAKPRARSMPFRVSSEVSTPWPKASV